MKIKTILFDIDNTIYNYDRANEEAIEKIYDYCRQNFQWEKALTKKLLCEAQREVKETLVSDCATLHNRLIRYQVMLENQKKDLFPHAQNLYHLYWDTLLEVMRAEPGVETLFQWLRSQNLKIGIATDMTAYIQYEKLKKLNLLSYVNFIVSSEEVGVEKPDKKLFHRCAQKASCKPCECLMIGDSLEKDVKGALRAGMAALWYNPKEKDDNCMENEGKTLHSFLELKNFLELEQLLEQEKFLELEKQK